MNTSSAYSIRECVGRGNFGDVYRAVERRSRRVVALKVVNLEYSDEDIGLLAQEIFFLAQLRSPYITNYLATCVEDVSMWIVMEYCGGGSCADLLKHCYRTGLPEPKVAYVVHNVLQGLQYLHDQKKIHRDIKAANILLTDSGAVKLADFGVSGQLSATLKRNTFVGTPYWMAPEIICRDPNDGYDEKADIWSLGITTYELLKGVPPLAKYDPVKVMRGLGKRRAPKLHGAFLDITKQFVAMCLTKNPQLRPGATQLLQTQFVQHALGRVTDLRDDVQMCKEVRGKDRLLATHKPKHSLSERFYDTRGRTSAPIWNFESVRVVEEPVSAVSEELWSPLPDSGQPETVTPLTQVSSTCRSLRKGAAPGQYELGSGMDIDSVKTSGAAAPQLQAAVPPVMNQQISNLDYFKNVVLYCLSRMGDRAKDEETRGYVLKLLQNFHDTEMRVPGFSAVFVEELMLRIDTINNYLTSK